MKQKGEKRILRLKKGAVPHIFLSQEAGERIGIVERRRIALVNEALSENAIKGSSIFEIGEPSQRNFHETRQVLVDSIQT